MASTRPGSSRIRRSVVIPDTNIPKRRYSNTVVLVNNHEQVSKLMTDCQLASFRRKYDFDDDSSSQAWRFFDKKSDSRIQKEEVGSWWGCFCGELVYLINLIASMLKRTFYAYEADRNKKLCT